MSSKIIIEEEEKIDFPFDLNTLVQYNYSFNMGFENLKKSIEYLARQHKRLDTKVNDM